MLPKLGAGQRAAGARTRNARDTFSRLNFELQAVSHRLEAVWLLMYTLLVKASATSANLRCACCCLSSASKTDAVLQTKAGVVS